MSNITKEEVLAKLNSFDFTTVPKLKLEKDQRITITRKLLFDLDEAVSDFTGKVSTVEKDHIDGKLYANLSIQDIINKLQTSELNLQDLTDEISISLDPNNADSFTENVTYTFDTAQQYVGLNSVVLNITVDGTTFCSNAEIKINSKNEDIIESLTSPEGLDVYLTKRPTEDAHPDFSIDASLTAPNGDKDYFGTEKINLKVDLEAEKHIILDSTNVNSTFKPDQTETTSPIGIAEISVTPVLSSFTLTPEMFKTESTSLKIEDISADQLDSENPLGLNEIILPAKMEDLEVNVELPTEDPMDNAFIVTSTENPVLELVHVTPIKHLNITVTENPNNLTENNQLTYQNAKGESITCTVSKGDIIHQDLGDDNKDPQTGYNKTIAWIYLNDQWQEYNNQILSSVETIILGQCTESSDTGEVIYQTQADKLGFDNITITTPGTFNYELTSAKSLIMSGYTDPSFLELTFNDPNKTLKNLKIPRIQPITQSVSAQVISDAINNKTNYLEITPNTSDNGGTQQNDNLLMKSIIIHLPQDKETFVAATEKNALCVLEAKHSFIGSLERKDVVDIDIIDLEDDFINQFAITDFSGSTDLTNTFTESTEDSNKITNFYFINQLETTPIKITLTNPVSGILSVYQLDYQQKSDSYDDNNLLFKIDFDKLVSSADNSNKYTYIIKFTPDFSFSTLEDENGNTVNQIQNFTIVRTYSIFPEVTESGDSSDLITVTEDLDIDTVWNAVDIASLGSNKESKYICANFADNYYYGDFSDISIDLGTPEITINDSCKLKLEPIGNNIVFKELTFNNVKYDLTKSVSPLTGMYSLYTQTNNIYNNKGSIMLYDKALVGRTLNLTPSPMPPDEEFFVFKKDNTSNDYICDGFNNATFSLKYDSANNTYSYDDTSNQFIMLKDDTQGLYTATAENKSPFTVLIKNNIIYFYPPIDIGGEA